MTEDQINPATPRAEPGEPVRLEQAAAVLASTLSAAQEFGKSLAECTELLTGLSGQLDELKAGQTVIVGLLEELIRRDDERRIRAARTGSARADRGNDDRADQEGTSDE